MAAGDGQRQHTAACLPLPMAHCGQRDVRESPPASFNDVNGGPSGIGVVAADKAAFWDSMGAGASPKVVDQISNRR